MYNPNDISVEKGGYEVLDKYFCETLKEIQQNIYSLRVMNEEIEKKYLLKVSNKVWKIDSNFSNFEILKYCIEAEQQIYII